MWDSPASSLAAMVLINQRAKKRIASDQFNVERRRRAARYFDPINPPWPPNTSFPPPPPPIPQGCICPPGAELTCQGPFCPRRNHGAYVLIPSTAASPDTGKMTFGPPSKPMTLSEMTAALTDLETGC